VWDAETTTDRDRNNAAHPGRRRSPSAYTAIATPPTRGVELVVRWKGGAISELTVPINRTPINRLRTEEDTVDLMRRLAVHYPDGPHRAHPQPARPPHHPRIAFTASRVHSLRHRYESPTKHPPTTCRKENCLRRGRQLYRRSSSASLPSNRTTPCCSTSAKLVLSMPGVPLLAHTVPPTPAKDVLAVNLVLQGVGPSPPDQLGVGRVRGWRGGPGSVSSPSPSNRACGFPAHGSPTFFTVGDRPLSSRTERPRGYDGSTQGNQSEVVR
jgi:hypothetical protein